MGLDMYLHKRYDIRNWDFMDENKLHHVTLTVDSEPSAIPTVAVSSIEIFMGDWRKANAIHLWFVQHVQGGEDDCGDYLVSEEELQELLDTVNKVLEASTLVDGTIKNGERYTIAQELLPTTSGFFFGSTDYNQYYYEDLFLTKLIIENALVQDDLETDTDAAFGEFYYSSSW